MTDAIGWAAAAVLLLTILRQVHTQWRNGSAQGVSPWLFVGQITASALFVTYSWLQGDAVFVATNGAMLATAIAGQVIDLRNRRRGRA